MSYHEQSFAGRFGSMGDEAEGRYIELHPNSVRYGLNRPPIGLGKVPAMIRYTPDYLQHDRLVECMGIGRDGILKLKLEKLHAMEQWNMVFPVFLFVWDSNEKRYTTIPLRDLHKMCLKDGEPKQFHDDKWAWWLNLRQQFVVEWHDWPLYA